MIINVNDCIKEKNLTYQEEQKILKNTLNILVKTNQIIEHVHQKIKEGMM